MRLEQTGDFVLVNSEESENQENKISIEQNTSNDLSKVQIIQRYLSIAWTSGGIPVIVLTKSDLVSNKQEYIEEVQSIAFGVDVYAISCINNDGIEDLKKYFSKISSLKNSKKHIIYIENTLYVFSIYIKRGE